MRGGTWDRKPKRPKVPEKRLEALAVGDWLEGTVSRLVPFGAWVDVGAQLDGFLHVSNMLSRDGAPFVQHPTDAVVPGLDVQVCVAHVDASGHKLLLSCRPVESAAVAQRRLHLQLRAGTSGGASGRRDGSVEGGRDGDDGDGDDGDGDDGDGDGHLARGRGRRRDGGSGSPSRVTSPSPSPSPSPVPSPSPSPVVARPVSSYAAGEEVWGLVTRVTTFGAYVAVGAAVDAFLHVADCPERLVRPCADRPLPHSGLLLWP